MATFQEIFADATPGPYKCGESGTTVYAKQEQGSRNRFFAPVQNDYTGATAEELRLVAQLFSISDLLPRALDLLAVITSANKWSESHYIKTLELLREARRRIDQQ